MATDIFGHHHRQARAALLQNFLGAQFHRVINAAEHTGYGGSLEALGTNVGCNADNGVFIEGRNFAPVELITALHLIAVITDDFFEIIRPIHHRRQTRSRRQTEADSRHLVHVAALDHRIGEMGRANHHGTNRSPIYTGRFDNLFQGLDDTRGHIFRRGCFHPRQNGFFL